MRIAKVRRHTSSDFTRGFELIKAGGQSRLHFKDEIDRLEPTMGHHFYKRFSAPYLGGPVLDVGCWVGDYLSLLEGDANVGVDIEARALRAGRRGIRASLVRASVLSLPFRNEVFQTVTMWSVIEHFPVASEPRALAEASRVMRPGAHLLLSTMYKHPLSDLLDPAYYLTGHRHYAIDGLCQLMGKANLRVKFSFRQGGFMIAFYTILFYVFKHVFNVRMPSGSFLDRLLLREYRNIRSYSFYNIFLVAEKP